MIRVGVDTIVAWRDSGIVVVTYTAGMHGRMLRSVGFRDVSGRRVTIRCSPVPPSALLPFLSQNGNLKSKFRVYIIYIYYSFISTTTSQSCMPYIPGFIIHTYSSIQLYT